MLNEKKLSECYDTLENVYDAIYTQPFFKGQDQQLDHLNNAMLIVNEWYKGITGPRNSGFPTETLTSLIRRNLMTQNDLSGPLFI